MKSVYSNYCVQELCQLAIPAPPYKLRQALSWDARPISGFDGSATSDPMPHGSSHGPTNGAMAPEPANRDLATRARRGDPEAFACEELR